MAVVMLHHVMILQQIVRECITVSEYLIVSLHVCLFVRLVVYYIVYMCIRVCMCIDMFCVFVFVCL